MIVFQNSTFPYTLMAHSVDNYTFAGYCFNSEVVKSFSPLLIQRSELWFICFG